MLPEIVFNHINNKTNNKQTHKQTNNNTVADFERVVSNSRVVYWGQNLSNVKIDEHN